LGGHQEKATEWVGTPRGGDKVWGDTRRRSQSGWGHREEVTGLGGGTKRRVTGFGGTPGEGRRVGGDTERR